MKQLQNNPAPAAAQNTTKNRRRRRRHPVIRFLRRTYRFLIRALRIPQIHLDGFLIGKGMVCVALLLLFALLQTTLLARFRPFGAIPDLMLSAVIAIAMLEGEKWGCLIGMCAAFIIDALGGGAIHLLPLLYMPAGYFVPVATELYFTDSAPVRFLYSAIAGIGRAILTLMLLAMTVTDFSLPGLFLSVVLPEYASTLLLSIPVQILVRTVLHPFHKSRSERVGTI
jgi:cell shape-determining protein MreD